VYINTVIIELNYLRLLVSLVCSVAFVSIVRYQPRTVMLFSWEANHRLGRK